MVLILALSFYLKIDISHYDLTYLMLTLQSAFYRSLFLDRVLPPEFLVNLCEIISPAPQPLNASLWYITLPLGQMRCLTKFQQLPLINFQRSVPRHILGERYILAAQ